MRERLPHSNDPARRKRADQQRHAQAKRRRVAVGIGVVTALTRGGHVQSARAYYAAGNSCEQAVFAAFAGEMGLSLVGALQAAPRTKDRGSFCGAYRAGAAVLSKLLRAGASDAALNEYRRSFLAAFGSAGCAQIKAGRRDCLGVVEETARLVDTLIEKYGP